MKKKAFLTGVLSVMLVLGLVITACDDATSTNGNNNNDGNNNNTTNPFVGTWTGSAQTNGGTSVFTANLTASSWNMSYTWTGPGGPQNGSESGTYTYSGNTATLSAGGETVGTATVSGSTVSVNITSGSLAGSYSLTKN